MSKNIFGGAGLRMEREAAGANLCCHNLFLERLTTNFLAKVNLTKVSLTTRFLAKVNLTKQSGNLGEILCESASCNSCSNRSSHQQVQRF